MAKDLAVVLNNGSLNSAVVTALAAQKYRPIMIYVEATSNSASRCRAAYDQQVAHFKPYREHTLPMPFLSTLQSSVDTQSVDPRQSGLLPPRLVNLLPFFGAAIPFASHYGFFLKLSFSA